MSNNFKVGFYYHVDPDGKKKLEFANIAERRSFAVCTVTNNGVIEPFLAFLAFKGQNFVLQIKLDSK